MSTNSKKIENSTTKYNNLKKNLTNQSTDTILDTILEWKEYFESWKNHPDYDSEYFLMAIDICDDILKERSEK